MKNIVTIDFDIIMAPCIDLYNDLIAPNGWEYFLHIPQLQTLTADLEHYQKITKWLIKTIKYLNKEDIVFIENHAQIINYLDTSERINIYNIDHHHDCGYRDDENKSKDELNLTCGNWGLHLKHMNLLNKFVWINNENSNDPPRDKRQVNYVEYPLNTFNLDNLPYPDKLIICLSEPWVPPMFRPLYFSWMDIFNEYFNTRFEVDYTRH